VPILAIFESYLTNLAEMPMNSGARTLDRSWNIAEQTILVQALWVAGFAAATALAARV